MPQRFKHDVLPGTTSSRVVPCACLCRRLVLPQRVRRRAVARSVDFWELVAVLCCLVYFVHCLSSRACCKHSACLCLWCCQPDIACHMFLSCCIITTEPHQLQLVPKGRQHPAEPAGQSPASISSLSSTTVKQPHQQHRQQQHSRRSCRKAVSRWQCRCSTFARQGPRGTQPPGCSKPHAGVCVRV